MQILVWGCGERSQFFIERNYIQLENIIGFIDNNENIKEWLGKRVYRPDESLEIAKECDYILITLVSFRVNQEIYSQAKKLGIPSTKLLFVYNSYRNVENKVVHQQNDDIFRSINYNLYLDIIKAEKVKIENAIDVHRCAKDSIDTTMVVDKGIFRREVYLKDYFRFRTFEFVADEIEHNQLQGAVAELGVFRGDFAKLINAKFPKRKLYLFDSFESFPVDEFKEECKAGNCQESFWEVFTHTDIELVIENMLHIENVIIRKGYFPRSVLREDMEEKFVFVSLDVDFEESTFQGLKFFYPRLVENGYIFLHDYNNSFFRGVKKAIARYELEEGIILKKVPLCDEGGTVVILK